MLLVLLKSYADLEKEYAKYRQYMGLSFMKQQARTCAEAIMRDYTYDLETILEAPNSFVLQELLLITQSYKA